MSKIKKALFIAFIENIKQTTHILTISPAAGVFLQRMCLKFHAFKLQKMSFYFNIFYVFVQWKNVLLCNSKTEFPMKF